MEKNLEKMMPLMKEYLREHFGEGEVEERWRKVEDLDEKWLKEEGDLGGAANPMSIYIKLCYAMCAFYESTDRTLSSEDFQMIAKDVMGMGILHRLDMNSLQRKKWLMKAAYKVMGAYKKKADSKRGGAWGNTWKIRINPDGHAVGIAYTLDSCPLYEFALKHGYGTFMKNFCAMDPYVAGLMKAKLIRHNILSDGDPFCEYWYVGDRCEEALADKGSK